MDFHELECGIDEGFQGWLAGCFLIPTLLKALD